MQIWTGTIPKDQRCKVSILT
uniref:Uncharacterized protein n=1 Tax=Anguilla anguilla TaxID=7936 RepID=A0A0E9UJ19_ANGAN